MEALAASLLLSGEFPLVPTRLCLQPMDHGNDLYSTSILKHTNFPPNRPPAPPEFSSGDFIGTGALGEVEESSHSSHKTDSM